jgi:tryptophanyl-tRNA synthetase
MRARRQELLRDPDGVEDILRAGAARATDIAEQTMERVRKAVGLR